VTGEQPSTWITGDRPIARLVARPLQRFIHVEAAGGIALVAATLVALVWANSPWKHGYEHLWHTVLAIRIGSHGISGDLHFWVNEALMALFFFVVGLEIKRELVTGELRDRRAALLPALAALGGVVVPALVYVAFNAGTPAARGWGIPMATDIAFTLGVVALLAGRVPPPLKLFLLTLAIVDDIAAIVVIAVVYSDHLSFGWLVVAAGIAALLAGLRRVRVVFAPVYVVTGLVLWVAVYESGVHATIAGVVAGLLTPATPFLADPDANRVVERLVGRSPLTAEDVRDGSFELRASVSVAERAEHVLHPWVGFVIVPLFALANAGIVLSGDTVSAAPRVLLGVLVGLVLGKPIGIMAGSWLAVRTRLGVLPPGVGWRDLFGVALLGGIGFTVSLFISDLAFTDASIIGQAKFAVLVASVVAAGLGVLWFAATSRPGPG